MSDGAYVFFCMFLGFLIGAGLVGSIHDTEYLDKGLVAWTNTVRIP